MTVPIEIQQAKREGMILALNRIKDATDLGRRFADSATSNGGPHVNHDRWAGFRQAMDVVDTYVADLVAGLELDEPQPSNMLPLVRRSS